MDRNSEYWHNNYDVMYDRACKIATDIKNQLQQPNKLPQHSNLMLENEYDINLFEASTMIEFTSPISNRKGQIIIEDPEFMQRNIEYSDLNETHLDVFCMIDAYNGYFMNITVNSLEEVLAVLEFCQQILDCQPDEDELQFVNIPSHILNHLFGPDRLGDRNLRKYNMNID